MQGWKQGPRHGGWLSVAVMAGSLGLIGTGLAMWQRGEVHSPDMSASGMAAGKAADEPVADASDTLSARFSLCASADRDTCVVDGDTLWFRGDKIRVLDINTPETSTPRCDREYALGKQATERFMELLNAGPFSLEAGDEETDRYGRKLRRVTRGGRSLGDILVAEGLAEEWQGHRRNWC